jgi:hypothetical protein
MADLSFEITSEEYCGQQQEANPLNVELFRAAQEGNLVALKKALEKGANPNFIDQHEEGNPSSLHQVVKIEDETTRVECTRLLLEKGAETSLQLISSRNTPLHEGLFTLSSVFEMNLFSMFTYHVYRKSTILSQPLPMVLRKLFEF